MPGRGCPGVEAAPPFYAPTVSQGQPTPAVGLSPEKGDGKFDSRTHVFLIFYFVLFYLFYNQINLSQQYKICLKIVVSRYLLSYLAFQYFQLSSLGLKESLRFFKDLKVVILIEFCCLDVSLQTLKPTWQGRT